MSPPPVVCGCVLAVELCSRDEGVCRKLGARLEETQLRRSSDLVVYRGGRKKKDGNEIGWIKRCGRDGTKIEEGDWI